MTAQTHPATVLAVHDGDTISVSVPLLHVSKRLKDRDLSFHLHLEGGAVCLHAPIRLLGCNAIELAQPGGTDAQQHLATLLPVGTALTLSTIAADKYGTRWDAQITLPDGSDLVTTLIRDQWAAPWNGQGPKPVPPWPRTVP